MSLPNTLFPADTEFDCIFKGEMLLLVRYMNRELIGS